MNDRPAISTMIPPHLSMDEYVDFIEASIKEANPVFAARQKDIEEQITRPFRLLFNPTLTAHFVSKHGRGNNQGSINRFSV